MLAEDFNGRVDDTSFQNVGETIGEICKNRNGNRSIHFASFITLKYEMNFINTKTSIRILGAKGDHDQY